MSQMPPEIARDGLKANAHRLPWDKPETIVVKELLIGNVERKLTLIELICIAYDLKPNK